MNVNHRKELRVFRTLFLLGLAMIAVATLILWFNFNLLLGLLLDFVGLALSVCVSIITIVRIDKHSNVSH